MKRKMLQADREFICEALEMLRSEWKRRDPESPNKPTVHTVLRDLLHTVVEQLRYSDITDLLELEQAVHDSLEMSLAEF